mgnify:FL=1
MYRPPSLFGGVKNGFQGVPERYKWVPHAMLANRRSRAGYPLSGTLHRLAMYRGYGYNFLFFIVKISTLFCQTVLHGRKALRLIISAAKIDNPGRGWYSEVVGSVSLNADLAKHRETSNTVNTAMEQQINDLYACFCHNP